MTDIDDAFRANPRANFLPDWVKGSAAIDVALPIGYGSTNSQPSTVAKMLEWLAVEPGQKILDLGSGSGWTSALLAYLTGLHGRVVAVEKIPELVAFGRDNCARLGIQNVAFQQAGSSYGWPPEAPYDRILVSAAASAVPIEILDQLAAPGRLVIPIYSVVMVVDKDASGNLQQQEYPGFIFVPLV